MTQEVNIGSGNSLVPKPLPEPMLTQIHVVIVRRAGLLWSDYFGRNKISSGGDLSHYSSASLY